MHYDVEADFALLRTCNYRCSYCFVPTDQLGEKITVHGTNDEWRLGFDATRRTWLIHLTGGEPFLYPRFVDLCSQLCERHYLSINSNLSHRNVEEFAAVINPERVHFINAALHYDERVRRNEMAAFIARVQQLQAARFRVLVSCVMTPAVLARFAEIDELFSAHGICVIPKIVRRRIDGIRYPEGYTDAERSAIRAGLEKARLKYSTTRIDLREPPTIDLFSEDGIFFDGPKSYQGRWCAAGARFVMIKPDGSVWRCNSGEALGNILQHNVELLSYVKPCDTHYCAYFCNKYTAAQYTRGERRRSGRVALALAD